MIGSKRRGESTAPALFPFLAVLLCTIGALILILVVTVTRSHASAKKEVEEELEELRDTADLVQTVSEELQAQRDKLRSEVERRRRELEHIEDHISRLRQDMERIIAKAFALEQQSEQTEENKESQVLEVARLTTQIDAKKQELADEIEKQKKRKPAFAIIPYDGPNGTSRRPIYLECTRDGVIIQPEGLLISIDELKPPYGPGNPLDAALRVLRVAYQKRDNNFGIIHPPYPLLMIRPDGVTSYAMARAAMGGWDDQLGYELIEPDMDLAFPPGVEGLKNQLESALDLARKRQSVLAASMPRQSRGRDAFEEEPWDGAEGQAAGQTRGGNGSAGHGDGLASGGNMIELPNAKGDRWEMIQPLPPGQQYASSGQPLASHGAGQQGYGQSHPGAGRMPSMPTANGSQFTGFENTNGTDPSRTSATTPPGISMAANNGIPNDQLNVGATQQNMGGPSSNPIDGRSSDVPSGNSTGPVGTGVDRGGAGTPGDSTGSGGAAGAGGPTGGAAGAGGAGGAGAGASPQPGGNTIGNGPPTNPDGSRANAFSSGSASSAGGGAMQGTTGASSSPSGDPADPSNGQSPNLSVSMNQGASPAANKKPKAKHVRNEGDLSPISVSAGRDWATVRAESKATPVSRPIFIIALSDRWLIRSDSGSTSFESTITMEDGPQEAGKTLATAIRKRVDSWGVSVKGGYWVPSLTIEAASDASLSVARLQRLLEGSGVEIRVVPLQLPKKPSGK